jgi:hypothetical protein
MIKGSCLCGGVKFEIRGSKGPFELCHCNRCRKATGSAFAAGLRVRGEDLRIVQGQELIKTFEAPIVTPRRRIRIASVVVAAHPYRCRRTTDCGLRFRRAPLMMIRRYDQTNTSM